MIGVHVPEARRHWVEELFQLFKTAWEPARRGQEYPVEVVFGDCPSLIEAGRSAPLTVVYGGEKHLCDERLETEFRETQTGGHLRWGDDRIPVYGKVSSFSNPDGLENLTVPDIGPAGFFTVEDRPRRVTVRLGYDLLGEIEYLLTRGQPAANALLPTLELHLDLLRTLILDSGQALTEIPPAPGGYRYTCCLTHDIDFLEMRRHGLDATTLGFLARATVGSLAEGLGGRRPWKDVLTNWSAALKWPLVQAGLSEDYWKPFKLYRSVEKDLPSTFFLVPFKGQPGLPIDGKTVGRRAVAYDIDDVARLHDDEGPPESAELALHGIDAWHDAGSGRRELDRIRSLSPDAIGVRMHWLYFKETTPQHLDEAGFDYDSTFGYNDAVGFRAGTSQAFRFRGTRRLLEVPMILQDTAMFYRDRMRLFPSESLPLMDRVIDAHRRFGGMLVVNWHERSLAPERLWGAPYGHLLEKVRGEPVWFATVRDAVTWYRWRRSLRFEPGGRHTEFRVSSPSAIQPGGIVRVRQARQPVRLLSTLPASRRTDFSDHPFAASGTVPASVTVDAPVIA